MAVEGWFHDLLHGRLEVFFKTDDLKVRASGSDAEMNELADWFERKTGLVVNGLPRRARKGPTPLPGQLALDSAPTLELSSQDATVADDG